MRSKAIRNIHPNVTVISSKTDACDKDGNVVNFVWTAAHVIDNLRQERKVIVNGSPRTVVTFKDAKIIKVIRQNGRTVGRLELSAEVIKLFSFPLSSAGDLKQASGKAPLFDTLVCHSGNLH